MKALSISFLGTFLLASAAFAQADVGADQTWKTTKFATSSAKSVTVAVGEREMAALSLPAKAELSVTAIGFSPQTIYNDATQTHTITAEHLLVRAQLDGRQLLDLRFENATAEVEKLETQPTPIPASSLRPSGAEK